MAIENPTTFCRCGKPTQKDSKTCTDCQTKDRKYRTLLRQKRVSAGLCARCGTAAARLSKKTCLECGKITNERAIERQNRRKAQGLCPQCGDSMPVPEGFILCDKCRGKYRDMSNERDFDGMKPAILTRDGFQCRLCNNTESLVVHHIDGSREKHPETNNAPSNLITLCNRCHRNLEGLLMYVEDVPLLYALLKRRPLDSPDSAQKLFTFSQPTIKRVGLKTIIHYQGRAQSVVKWAKELNINPHSLCSRFKHGFTVEEAFTIKKGKQREMFKELSEKA